MRWLPITLLLLSSVALPQGVTHPKQDSPERKAILSALRALVEKDLKQRVVFQVDQLNVSGSWAFMTGKPKTATGRAIDYRKTRYREALESGAFDDWICAIFKREGKVWRVKRFAIGATDVVWDGWDKEFKAPRAIFPYGQ
jgi:hypothetical protein